MNFYKFYAYNKGEYTAYLNSIIFIGNKTCTATTDVTETLLNEACNSIKMTVQVGNTSTEVTKQNITGESIDPKEAALVTVTLEYIDGGAYADGNFTVNFSDVSLYYGTREGLSEEVNPGAGTTPTVPEGKICAAMDSSKSASTTVGTKYFCNVSDTESHNFYVLGTSTDGSKVNLLMNDNLDVNGDGVANESDYIPMFEPRIYSFESSVEETLYSLTQVETLTSDWNKLINYDESYQQKEAYNTETIYLTKLSGKARFPKYEELAALCPSVGSTTTINGEWGEYETEAYRYGCPTWVTDTSYWTMDIFEMYDPVAWAVHSGYKTLDDFNLYVDSGVGDQFTRYTNYLSGIRPVITVNATDLS